jgi:uncharacterized protein YndB with AHSA1/START domain
MNTLTNEITVKTSLKSPVEKVWEFWNDPQHITKWNNASDDWHSPKAEQDLRPGGRFLVRMEAKDGSFGFDFEGVYDQVEPHRKITYTMGDGRKVKILFEQEGNTTKVTETFEAESENSLEMQQEGWQAILDNFKKYTESN